MSYSRFSASAAVGSAPDIADRSAFALPRVECSSSLVAMNDGHITPPSVLRQAPCPLHISIPRANPPSCAKAKPVFRRGGEYSGPMRRFSVIGCAFTILPGFIMPLGSKARLTSWNAP